jgi:hypothetical protein
LQGAGVDCVILEARSRDYIEGRASITIAENYVGLPFEEE